jgi:hypothetical protein
MAQDSLTSYPSLLYRAHTGHTEGGVAALGKEEGALDKNV